MFGAWVEHLAIHFMEKKIEYIQNHGQCETWTSCWWWRKIKKIDRSGDEGPGDKVRGPVYAGTTCELYDICMAC